jgi:hypothetical protein
MYSIWFVIDAFLLGMIVVLIPAYSKIKKYAKYMEDINEQLQTMVDK